jgi:hypothetical protein
MSTPTNRITDRTNHDNRKEAAELAKRDERERIGLLDGFQRQLPKKKKVWCRFRRRMVDDGCRSVDHDYIPTFDDFEDRERHRTRRKRRREYDEDGAPVSVVTAIERSLAAYDD